MYSIVLLAVVILSSFFALQNWRLGLLLCFIVGLIQDPIRKVTPGTPPYYIIAFVPVYVAMFIGLLNERPAVRDFFRYFPHSLTVAQLFFACLAISSVVTLTYSALAVPAVLLGWVFYVGWIPAFFLGFYFLRKDYRELDRPLIIFGALTSVMLVGVSLEYMNVRLNDRWLGMVASTREMNIRYTGNIAITMISGFYRAAEIMAWHAATLVVVSIYLLVRRPTLGLVWLPQAAWGLACVFLGGRRKMFILVLIFVGLFILLSEGRRRGGMLFSLLFISALIAFFGTMFVDARYLDTAKSSFEDANKRVTSQAVNGPLWLLGMVGPFGYGVGTKSQGTQHLLTEVADTPPVEGGFEKVLVELGIVGTIAFLAFCITMIRLVVLAFRRAKSSRLDSAPMAALAAFLIANGMAYLTAFQVYADPLIGFFLGFSAGLLLSSSRLIQEDPTPVSPQNA